MRMKIHEKLKLFYLKIIDWFMLEPKRLVRLIVLSICSVVVTVQLWECVLKLLHPPVSTHSHFDLNETMYYPAVTFCREPGYKRDVMEKYNLSTVSNSWRNYPFDSVPLVDLFEEATYTQDEYFSYYTLNGDRDSIEVETTMHFTIGRCYTLIPKTGTADPVSFDCWKKSGFRVTLKHDEISDEEDDTRGWNILLHQPHEKFSEYGALSSGRIENLFLEVRESLELKLSVQHFTQLRGRGGNCSDEPKESMSMCRELCKWKNVEETVGCSLPFMTTSTARMCSSFEDLRDFIVRYSHNKMDNEACGCREPCYSAIYSSFVMNRKTLRNQGESSTVYIYYTSKMVSNIEERPGYDGSQFLADLGGSLGFLLGLSVIGLIVVLEKLLGVLFMNKMIESYKRRKLEKLPASSEKPEKSEKLNEA